MTKKKVRHRGVDLPNDDVTASEVSRAMAILGRRGGRIGGKRRLVTLTDEQRSTIARQAAHARWKKHKPQK